MPDAHKNFAVSTVATAPSPASSGTSLVVASGHGTRFPAAPFNATVWPAGAQPDPSNAEIVRVTNVATDTLTITRAQESTSARSIVVGDQIAAGVTAKTLTDAEAAYSTVQDEGSSLTARTTLDFAGWNVSAADSGGTKTLVTVAPGASRNVANSGTTLDSLYTNYGTASYVIGGSTSTSFASASGTGHAAAVALPPSSQARRVSGTIQKGDSGRSGLVTYFNTSGHGIIAYVDGTTGKLYVKFMYSWADSSTLYTSTATMATDETVGCQIISNGPFFQVYMGFATPETYSGTADATIYTQTRSGVYFKDYRYSLGSHDGVSAHQIGVG